MADNNITVLDNSNTGKFCQRIGLLIEEYICDRMQLHYNKRQQKYGYYDAYDGKNIYEIKATKQKTNTFLIREKNHKELLNKLGSYIFVCYRIRNDDFSLVLKSNIEMLDIVTIPAATVDTILDNRYTKTTERKGGMYWKVKIGQVHKLNNGGEIDD